MIEKKHKLKSVSVARGAMLTIIMRWSDRLIGLISTLILARLLAPEDIGIIAMSSLVIGLADVLLDLGVNVALIQNQQTTQAHYDTAWTLRLIQTALATLLVILAAPLAAHYFQDNRVQPVLQVLAFSLFFSGLENIGVVAFHKQMQFGAEFRFLFIRRLVGFLTTIVVAWLLRSYWALVIGTLVGRSFGVGLSYWLHPMRPRLSLSRFKEIFAVSQWMLVRGVGEFLQNHLHRLLVGRWSPTTIMGAYTLADEIAVMPAGELLAPVNRALFPALATAKENPVELRRLLLLAQSIQMLIAIPAAVGLALVANEAVPVLLGEKWRPAIPFLQVLALASIMQAMNSCGGYVLIVLGKMSQVTLIVWSQVGLFIVLALLMIPGGEALQVAWLRLIVALFGIGLSIGLLIRALALVSFFDMLTTAIRPLLGGAIMAGILIQLENTCNFSLVSLLIIKITVGIIIYPIVTLLLWQISGRPVGAESYLLGQGYKVLNRMRQRS